MSKRKFTLVTKNVTARVRKGTTQAEELLTGDLYMEQKEERGKGFYALTLCKPGSIKEQHHEVNPSRLSVAWATARYGWYWVSLALLGIPQAPAMKYYLMKKGHMVQESFHQEWDKYRSGSTTVVEYLPPDSGCIMLSTGYFGLGTVSFADGGAMKMERSDLGTVSFIPMKGEAADEDAIRQWKAFFAYFDFTW